MEGKTLFVPRIDQSADKHMDFLKIYGEDDLRTLPSGVWGIKEPSDEWQSQKRVSAVCEAAERLDLILLPGEFYLK
jgi:5-formyltetrahydrofolate cyclo-ligase